MAKQISKLHISKLFSFASHPCKTTVLDVQSFLYNVPGLQHRLTPISCMAAVQLNSTTYKRGIMSWASGWRVEKDSIENEIQAISDEVKLKEQAVAEVCSSIEELKVTLHQANSELDQSNAKLKYAEEKSRVAEVQKTETLAAATERLQKLEAEHKKLGGVLAEVNNITRGYAEPSTGNELAQS